jgi:hypothetical protein
MACLRSQGGNRATPYFNLPSNRVIELGGQLEL